MKKVKYTNVISEKKITSSEFLRTYKDEAKKAFLTIQKVRTMFKSVYVFYVDPFGVKYAGVLKDDVFVCIGQEL